MSSQRIAIAFSAFAFSILAVGSALPGCSPRQSTDSGPAPSPATGSVDATPRPALTDVAWRCVELVGADGVPVPTTDAPPTLLIAADGRASGFAGVNRYGSDAAIGNARLGASTPLRFGPVMATRMAGPPERMALEHAFVAMLAEVREAVTSRRHDGTPELALRGAQGIRARFVTSDVSGDSTGRDSGR